MSAKKGMKEEGRGDMPAWEGVPRLSPTLWQHPTGCVLMEQREDSTSCPELHSPIAGPHAVHQPLWDHQPLACGHWAWLPQCKDFPQKLVREEFLAV